MVRVTDIKELNNTTNKATVSLFADDKTDVVDGMDIYGIPEGYGIEAGSSVLTASAEVAFMKTDGTWSWV